MTGRLGILLLLLCFVDSVQAQKKSWFTFPFSEEYEEGYFMHLGVNYTLYHSRFLININNQYQSIELNSMNETIDSIVNPAKLGFGTGISVNLNLLQNLHLQFNPTFVVHQGQYLQVIGKDSFNQKFFQNENTNSSSLELPLRLKFRSNPKFYKNKQNYYKAYLLGGGKMTHDINYKKNVEQYIKDKNENVLYTKPNYFSIETGVGFEFIFTYFKLNPEIRFSQTAHNLTHKRKPTTAIHSAVNHIGIRSLQFSIILE